MPNYLTYPFRTMRITQRYNGTTSHLPHMTGTPKEFALDEGGADTGRDWVFCPCDAMKIVRIFGVGTKGVNTVWLTSTTKCDLANGKQSIVTLLLTHPNDDDLKKLNVGQVLKRGEKICREGTDGATGNHIHMAVGLGAIIDTGWQCNSKNKWVLTTTGGAIKPEDAFYIDPEFTKVVDTKGLKFKYLPQEKPKAGKYKVTCDALNVREGTKEGDHIADVLTRGTTVEISKVKVGWNDEYWGKINKVGWVCLKYCKRV